MQIKNAAHFSQFCKMAKNAEKTPNRIYGFHYKKNLTLLVLLSFLVCVMTDFWPFDQSQGHISIKIATVKAVHYLLIQNFHFQF